jgi:ComF family protein
VKGTLTRRADELLGLFVPNRCAGCDRGLMRWEKSICLRCAEDLPRNRFHDDQDNAVEQLFRGKLRLQAASAFVKFTPKGHVQRMLHRLKYQADREVGLELGRRMGKEAMASRRFADVEIALAVPLHPRKLLQRGYNQAQVLVDGMCLEWPVRSMGAELLRVSSTSSQTKRGRLDRWLNVKEAFHVADPASLRGKHVLLVDDVITTGATIEACVLALSGIEGLRISVLSCACA